MDVDLDAHVNVLTVYLSLFSDLLLALLFPFILSKIMKQKYNSYFLSLLECQNIFNNIVNI